MNSASQVEAGLEEEGQVFPFSIPPKNTKKEFERSLSPIDWNECEVILNHFMKCLKLKLMH